MIDFAWPWVFALLPLPLLARWLLPVARRQPVRALRMPILDELEQASSLPGTASGGRRPWQLTLAGLIWLLLIGAAARPEWLGEPIELPAAGRDLMLAVDLSGSMREEDFQLAERRINRLQATKVVASDFLQRRVGDRVGLILFGERAYLQAPLTFDRGTVRTLLNEAAIGLAGAEATAIGDAIGLAVKRLRDRPASGRVLVLLTDGVNNAGAIAPVKAAELAAAQGLKIYTIGIGAESVQVRDLLGMRRVNPSRDLDEKTLKAIADATGGRYFRARDTAELEEIYRVIDALEPVAQDARVFRPIRALYPWPLGAALLLAAGLALYRTLPRRGRA
jgi:Ca-activated chloride channel homolog